MKFNGLKSSEVEASRAAHGSNKLPEPELKKWYHFAKDALTEPITMILIAIALFQLVLGVMGVMSLSEPVMIIVVLAIVTGIAIKTGLGVQKSAAELRAKTAVRYCDVIRDGNVQTINKDDLVVADIVLTDNNFASVVKGVELGRTFMHNIMMFLEFQLPINIALLILSTVFPIISGGFVFLAAVQILIVNIIMDSLNSLSFGGEPPKVEYMDEKPIVKGSGLFIRGAKGRIALSSIVFIALFGVITFGPIGKIFTTEISTMTARFSLLCLMAVFNGFTIRTDSMNPFKGIKNNKLFMYIAFGIFVMTVVLCNFVGNLVQTTPMTIDQWIAVLVTAFMVVPVDWIRKVICKKGSN